MELLVALVVAFATTPIVARAATRLGVVDQPGPLKTHRAPIPYLGGVAVFLGLLVGPIAVGRLALLAPLALALALGVADDVRPLPPALRLAAEVALGAVAAAVVPGPTLARFATGVLVVVLLNAVNLLDGQDGLAAGVGAVAALGFAALDGDARGLGLALAGALCGFLWLNRPPARIYLGDGGAYLVGTALALLPALTATGASAWSVWIAVPLLVALPVADTSIAILRRLRARRPLFAGDRSHVYDQLVDRGHRVAVSTLLCVAAQMPLTLAGAVGARLAPPEASAVTTAGIVLIAVVAIGGGFLSTPTPEGAT